MKTQEYYMEPSSGAVQTMDDWITDYKNDEYAIGVSFSDWAILIEVEKDSNGEWAEEITLPYFNNPVGEVDNLISSLKRGK